jgi:hypothetical protein
VRRERDILHGLQLSLAKHKSHLKVSMHTIATGEIHYNLTSFLLNARKCFSSPHSVQSRHQHKT